MRALSANPACVLLSLGLLALAGCGDDPARPELV
jgi:hypothetical protein